MRYIINRRQRMLHIMVGPVADNTHRENAIKRHRTAVQDRFPMLNIRQILHEQGGCHDNRPHNRFAEAILDRSTPIMMEILLKDM
ncbi:hypothetical protein D3C78_941080 [compost metagenome]